MPASAAQRRPRNDASKYWDARTPTEYHTDPLCRIGRWIPDDALYRGRTHAGRPCGVCAEGDDEGEGALLFAI
jgi:hypothetical protein